MHPPRMCVPDAQLPRRVIRWMPAVLESSRPGKPLHVRVAGSQVAEQYPVCLLSVLKLQLPIGVPNSSKLDSRLPSCTPKTCFVGRCWVPRTVDAMLGGRNLHGLTSQQIDRCIEIWEVLCGERARPFDVSEAMRHGSHTRFVQGRRVVVLGADAYPGSGAGANSRMSVLACLAHELAHAERFELGYDRPFEQPDSFLDEAETSLRASFTAVLARRDREDLIEDARDRLIDWLAAQNQE